MNDDTGGDNPYQMSGDTPRSFGGMDSPRYNETPRGATETPRSFTQSGLRAMGEGQAPPDMPQLSKGLKLSLDNIGHGQAQSKEEIAQNEIAVRLVARAPPSTPPPPPACQLAQGR